MANHKSAIKEHRQSVKRRQRNRGNRAKMRTAVKKLRASLVAGDAATARDLLPTTFAAVDRASKLGAVHANAAARTKSRLAHALTKLGN